MRIARELTTVRADEVLQGIDKSGGAATVAKADVADAEQLRGLRTDRLRPCNSRG